MIDTTIKTISEVETWIMDGDQVVAKIRGDAPKRYSIIVATGYQITFETVQVKEGQS